MLPKKFFNRDACVVAQELLGKVMRVEYERIWLSAQIIETEAYYLADKSSHSAKGYTEKRKAMFMPAGTIYMYYSRGADSMNISVKGEGNAILVKAGFPFIDDDTPANMINTMQRINPPANGGPARTHKQLCKGQTLLCKSLGVTVKEWDAKQFDSEKFYIEDVDYTPNNIIQTTRLGIPVGRDEHLLYRFIDHDFADCCSSNPLTKRQAPRIALIG